MNNSKRNIKNAVVVIAIGKSKFWDSSKKTFLKYCEKYNLSLEIITEKIYNIRKYDYHSGFNCFEKNQVYDLFNKYDRILRLDWDIIITPNCPNLFNIVPENKIGVVYEDIGSRKEDRRNRIKFIQMKLGDLDWRTGYINSGVIIASKQHKEIFHISLEHLELLENINLKVFKEQTYLNYLIRKLRCEIYELDFKFNHTRMFSEPWNGNPNRLNSYIIHYAGSARNAKNMIKYDFNRIFLKKIGLIETIKSVLRKKEKKYLNLISQWKLKNNKIFHLSYKFKSLYFLIKKYIININYS